MVTIMVNRIRWFVFCFKQKTAYGVRISDWSSDVCSSDLYTLSDEDLGHIRQRRRAHNRFGFALQLCVLRYPGRVLAPGELIPAQVSDFIAAQLGLTSDDLLLYAAREETRHEHLADLRRIYGYRSFSGRGARDLRDWIAREAEAATSNEDLARRFVAECRRTRTILPGSSTIERLCADALVEAELRIEDLKIGRTPVFIPATNSYIVFRLL